MLPCMLFVQNLRKQAKLKTSMVNRLHEFFPCTFLAGRRRSKMRNCRNASHACPRGGRLHSYPEAANATIKNECIQSC